MKVRTNVNLETSKSCVICGSITEAIEDTQIKVTYSQCGNCDFIYKDKEYHLDLEKELEQYDFHENSMENEGYINIFKDLINLHVKPLKIVKNVLEFGSGPYPALKILLGNEGYNVFDYDPFYNNNDEYKNRKYQLITTTEVVEHFSNPIKEFEHLFSLLEEEGFLIVMTRFRSMEIPEFLKWWYRRDLTHVSFYNLKTFEHIASKFNVVIESHNDINIITFQKKNSKF